MTEKLYIKGASLDGFAVLVNEDTYKCLLCEKTFSKYGIRTHCWLLHGEGLSQIERIAEMGRATKGHVPSHKGQTKDTNDRCRKMSETQKRKIAAGEITFKGFSHSAETRAKISKARSEFLSTRGNGGFKDVRWYRRKDSYGNECSLRGTWEVKVADWLDAHHINWTRQFSLPYDDGEIVRTYSPDFFLKDLNIIIEVKGFFSKKDQQKMLHVKEQNSQYRYLMLMKKEIDNLETVQEMLIA